MTKFGSSKVPNCCASLCRLSLPSFFLLTCLAPSVGAPSGWFRPCPLNLALDLDGPAAGCLWAGTQEPRLVDRAGVPRTGSGPPRIRSPGRAGRSDFHVTREKETARREKIAHTRGKSPPGFKKTEYIIFTHIALHTYKRRTRSTAYNRLQPKYPRLVAEKEKSQSSRQHQARARYPNKEMSSLTEATTANSIFVLPFPAHAVFFHWV